MQETNFPAESESETVIAGRASIERVKALIHGSTEAQCGHAQVCVSIADLVAVVAFVRELLHCDKD